MGSVGIVSAGTHALANNISQKIPQYRCIYRLYMYVINELRY